jgi:cytochrome c peroxidase
VHKALAEMKAAKKKTILAMKRDLFNGNEGSKPAQPTLNVDRERGLIDENGRFVTQHFHMHRTLPKVAVETRAYMHDATYNSLRTLFKDNNAL